VALATSEHPELIGMMAPFHLPGGTNAAARQRGLWKRFRLEASVIEHVEHPRFQASTHCYNTETNIDCLAEALGELPPG
jgi:hypothetical protein